MRHFRQRLQQIIAGSFLLLIVAGSASAATASKDISGAVAQSYSAGSGLQIGMIVEPQTGKAQTVIPLKSNDIRRMLGVVVPASNATIVIAPSAPTQQQVLVATAGHYSVLVSNQNGPIKVGDYITISSVDGIGMTADKSQPEIIGRADVGFTGRSNTLGTVKLKNQQGQASAVTLGGISVDISVGPNPLYANSPVLIPGIVNRFVISLAGKTVSPSRIYFAMIMLAITVYIVATILYGSVRGSMVALGRNPLSKQSIMRSLIVTVVTVLMIFTVGVFAVYLLLKL